MKLVDMKRTAADKKAEREKYDKPCSIGGDDYPYGLSLTLDAEMLKKLGISDLPKVGTVYTLQASATVTTVESREGTDSSVRHRKSMTLQMRRIGLQKGAASALAAVDNALDKVKT